MDREPVWATSSELFRWRDVVNNYDRKLFRAEKDSADNHTTPSKSRKTISNKKQGITEKVAKPTWRITKKKNTPRPIDKNIGQRTYKKEYEVEAIKAVRLVNGKKLYTVSWVGYPGQDTEEPEQHLKKVKDLVAAFEANLCKNTRKTESIRPQKNQKRIISEEAEANNEIVKKAKRTKSENLITNKSKTVLRQKQRKDSQYRNRLGYYDYKLSNAKKLKHRFNKRTIQRTQKQQTSSDNQLQQINLYECYEVDKIIGKKLVKGQTRYKVAWKGYKGTTWQTKADLEFVQDLIDEFEINQKSAQQSGYSLELKGRFESIDTDLVEQPNNFCDQFLPNGSLLQSLEMEFELIYLSLSFNKLSTEQYETEPSLQSQLQQIKLEQPNLSNEAILNQNESEYPRKTSLTEPDFTSAVQIEETAQFYI